MNDILFEVNEAIKNYYNKYERYPNAILINEKDLSLLKRSLSPNLARENEKAMYKIFDMKIIPIKYGAIQAVEEVLL